LGAKNLQVVIGTLHDGNGAAERGRNEIIAYSVFEQNFDKPGHRVRSLMPTEQLNHTFAAACSWLGDELAVRTGRLQGLDQRNPSTINAR